MEQGQLGEADPEPGGVLVEVGEWVEVWEWVEEWAEEWDKVCNYHKYREYP